MSTASQKWKNHIKAHPCPVCGKHDRCQFTDDGAHRCFRSIDERAGWKRIKVCRDNTGIYVKEDGSIHQKRARVQPAIDFEVEARRFTKALKPAMLKQFAAELGVSIESLQLLRCGYATEADMRRLGVFGQGWDVNHPREALTFPEVGELNRVISILFRAPDGRKGTPKGSTRGLIVPTNLKQFPGTPIGVEGPTDVAASLTVGIPAIGRSSNAGGAELLAFVAQQADLLVVGENDQRLQDNGDLLWPGRRGAESIARNLASSWNRPVQIAMPPEDVKDVRAYLLQQKFSPEDKRACEFVGKELLRVLVANIEVVTPAPPSLAFEVQHHANRSKATIRVMLDGRPVNCDQINISSSEKRTAFAEGVLAIDPRLKREDIEAKLLEAAVNPSQSSNEKPQEPTRENLLAELDATTQSLLAEMPTSVKLEAEEMLRAPDLINRLVSDIAELGVVGEHSLALTVYLVGTSRLLSKPLGAIVQGLSSTGKSFVNEKVSLLFPDETVLRCTDLTPQALFYMPPGRLIHRFVVGGERSRIQDDERAEATRPLREMLSSGVLHKVVAMKVKGRIETVVVRQDGPIAFVESTTLATVFEEDANRCLLLSTDETSQQTRRIIDALANNAVGASRGVEHVIMRHWALQRMLARVEVAIPFAQELSAHIPHERPESRRAFSHTLNLIKAVALLHQRQRSGAELRHGDTISATIDDYLIARRLLEAPLDRALGNALPGAVFHLGMRLLERYGHDEFTVTQAIADDPIIKTRGKLGEYLRTLEAHGFSELVSEGRGSNPYVWRMLKEPRSAGALWLPTAEQLEVAYA